VALSCFRNVYRSIALLFHDRGTRRWWVVSVTPRPHVTPGKDPVPILQEAGWASGPVWMGGKSRPHRDSISDRLARSQSQYRLSYPAHIYIYIYIYIYICLDPYICVQVDRKSHQPKVYIWYLLGMIAMQLNWWMNMLVWLCRSRVGTSTGNVTWRNLSIGFKIVRLPMCLYSWPLSSISILFLWWLFKRKCV